MSQYQNFEDFVQDCDPAFPVVIGAHVASGLKVRDYFAAKAMVGLLAARHADHGIEEGGEQVLAIDAYLIADAMLAERTNK